MCVCVGGGGGGGIVLSVTMLPLILCLCYSHAGTLNLVDLAGSESYAATALTPARGQESRHINVSLTTLKRVIQAIATKVRH